MNNHMWRQSVEIAHVQALRQLLSPSIIRRTGQDLNYDGSKIVDLKPYKSIILRLDLNIEEQEFHQALGVVNLIDSMDAQDEDSLAASFKVQVTIVGQTFQPPQ